MATQQEIVGQGVGRLTNQDCWIYDMDAHIIETDNDVRPYLDERYRNRRGGLLALDECT